MGVRPHSWDRSPNPTTEIFDYILLKQRLNIMLLVIVFWPNVVSTVSSTHALLDRTGIIPHPPPDHMANNRQMIGTFLARWTSCKQREGRRKKQMEMATALNAPQSVVQMGELSIIQCGANLGKTGLMFQKLTQVYKWIPNWARSPERLVFSYLRRLQIILQPSAKALCLDQWFPVQPPQGLYLNLTNKTVAEESIACSLV